jgi:transposase
VKIWAHRLFGLELMMEITAGTPMPDDRNYQVIEHLDVRSLRGRRQWSQEAKARLIDASLDPGANVSAIAREAGMAPSQLFGWRRKALGKSLPASNGNDAAVQFTRFEPACGAVIEIVVGDLIVRVSGNVDPEHLARVIRAARAA